MKGEKRELNHMNAVGCLAVILIHVLSLGISQADRRGAAGALLYFPWRLSAFVVPMFLYTGGIKLAGQFSGRGLTLRGWGRYLLRRFRKIYLPYVLWYCVYYGAFTLIHYVRPTPGDFFRQLLLGTLSSPFYYIVIVMQFYFLAPLWLWMVQKIPMSLGLGLGLLCSIGFQRLGGVLSLFSISFPYADRIFPTYLFFWLWGLYVGGEEGRLESQRLRGRGPQALCAALILLCTSAGYLLYRGWPEALPMNEVKLVSDALSILLLHSLCLELEERGGRLRPFLTRVARLSFPVYLCHCLFLTLTTAFLWRCGITRLSIQLPLRALVCYTLPFLLCALWQRLRGRRTP